MKPLGVMKNLYSTTVVFLVCFLFSNSQLLAQGDPTDCITITDCPADITVCADIFDPIIGANVVWNLPDASQTCSGGPGGDSFQMMFELNEQQLGVDCWDSHYISRVGSENVKLFSGSAPEGEDSYIITPFMYLQTGDDVSIDVTYMDGDYDLYVTWIDDSGTPGGAATSVSIDNLGLGTHTVSVDPLLPSDGIYKIKYLFRYIGSKPSNMNTFDNISIEGVLIDATCTGGIDFTFLSTHNPGDFFPVGTTTVTYTATYTATDGSYYDEICEFDVTVLDITLNITEVVQPDCHTLGYILQ